MPDDEVKPRQFVNCDRFVAGLLPIGVESMKVKRL
jgi:hypothetical protein